MSSAEKDALDWTLREHLHDARLEATCVHFQRQVVTFIAHLDERIDFLEVVFALEKEDMHSSKTVLSYPLLASCFHPGFHPSQQQVQDSCAVLPSVEAESQSFWPETAAMG
jgi:hypothetical protein